MGTTPSTAFKKSRKIKSGAHPRVSALMQPSFQIKKEDVLLVNTEPTRQPIINAEQDFFFVVLTTGGGG